jgi:hypothetical protein
MVLAAPAFRVKLYVPMAVAMLRLRQRLFGAGFVKSYVKAHMLTHDAAQAAKYRDDPAIFRQIAVNILLDLHDTSTRLLKDAGAIATPTLILGAGRDWVVRLDAQWRFYRGLSSSIKQMDVLHNMGHAIFHETDSGLVIERARQFPLECFARPPQRAALIHADRGHKHEESNSAFRKGRRGIDCHVVQKWDNYAHQRSSDWGQHFENQGSPVQVRHVSSQNST